MTLTFNLPSRARASALRGIAGHVPALTLVSLPCLPENQFAVSRQGRQILWHVADEGVEFDIDSLLGMEVTAVEMNGVEFPSLILEFLVPERPLAYRFITCTSDEADWLRRTAKPIGEFIGIQVADHTTVEPGIR